MDWVESQINNEDIFPIDKGTDWACYYDIKGSLQEAAWPTMLDSNLKVLELKSSSQLLMNWNS